MWVCSYYLGCCLFQTKFIFNLTVKGLRCGQWRQTICLLGGPDGCWDQHRRAVMGDFQARWQPEPCDVFGCALLLHLQPIDHSYFAVPKLNMYMFVYSLFLLLIYASYKWSNWHYWAILSAQNQVISRFVKKVDTRQSLPFQLKWIGSSSCFIMIWLGSNISGYTSIFATA